MESELKQITPTRLELKIEIDSESLKAAYGKVSQRYSRGASVPGFRKGFAPLDVVRLRYKEEIKNEVLQLLIPDRISAAIAEHNINPIAEPHLHIEDHEKIKVNGSETIKLTAFVEVMPVIPMPDYEGMKLVRRVKQVEDSEIEDMIAERLNNEAALIPVEDRASAVGDTVIADLEGTFVDDPQADPIRVEDVEIKLGDEVIEEAFTENLIGVKEDEEKEFRIIYPSDFSSSELAGKTVDYKARIKSVGTMETPEANDEWARTLDEGYESLEDLRKKLRSEIETYAKNDADSRLRSNAIGKLIEDNVFEVPDTLIDSQARNLLNNFAAELQQQGADLNKMKDDFVQMAYLQMRKQAERDVRGAMLLDKVAEAEKIEVLQSDIDEEVSKLAEYYRLTPDDVKSTLEKQGGFRNIENNLRTRKTIEALISKAVITDGKWVDDSEAEAAGEALKEPVSDGKKQKSETAKGARKRAAKSKA